MFTVFTFDSELCEKHFPVSQLRDKNRISSRGLSCGTSLGGAVAQTVGMTSGHNNKTCWRTATAGVTILVPDHLVKSLQFI